MIKTTKKTDETAAWQAFEKGDYTQAEALWKSLLSAETNVQARDQYLSAYCYTLCKLKKYDAALKIYEELYKKYGSPIYLRQMATVELERGNYNRALQYISAEQSQVYSRSDIQFPTNEDQDQ